jgi:hypothetical protein
MRQRRPSICDLVRRAPLRAIVWCAGVAVFAAPGRAQNDAWLAARGLSFEAWSFDWSRVWDADCDLLGAAPGDAPRDLAQLGDRWYECSQFDHLLCARVGKADAGQIVSHRSSSWFAIVDAGATRSSIDAMSGACDILGAPVDALCVITGQTLTHPGVETSDRDAAAVTLASWTDADVLELTRHVGGPVFTGFTWASATPFIHLTPDRWWIRDPWGAPGDDGGEAVAGVEVDF